MLHLAPAPASASAALSFSSADMRHYMCIFLLGQLILSFSSIFLRRLITSTSALSLCRV